MTKRFLLGVEIGGTKLQLGLGDASGRLLALDRFVVSPERGAAGIREQIRAAVGPLASRVGASARDILAVGIGFGGPVETERGVVVKSHQIEGWDQFPLANWIQHELGVSSVAIQNDADTAGLGEARFGAGQGVSPVLYVTVGSGIGGGLIVDGRIYRGSGHGAVEIGHLWIEDERVRRKKLLEHIASGWALGAAGRELLESPEGQAEAPVLNRLAGGDPRRVTGSLVAEAAEHGDPVAGRILAAARAALAESLAHAVTLLAPRRIILGGGVSTMTSSLWIDPIRAHVDERVFGPFRGTYDIVTAALGEEVVIHGALALAADLAAREFSS
jgi:glucokinase